MTGNGVTEFYNRLSVAWPMVYKPGVSEEWKRSALKSYYDAFRDYTDAEALMALMKWTQENEKPPTIKNIINELQWARKADAIRGQENERYWPMDCIDKDGNEWTWGSFKRADFINHPRNPERLTPEQWERRFKRLKKRWWESTHPPLTPEQEAWRQRVMAGIRAHVEMVRRKNNDGVH